MERIGLGSGIHGAGAPAAPLGIHRIANRCFCAAYLPQNYKSVSDIAKLGERATVEEERNRIAFLGTKLATSAGDVKVLQSLAPSEFVREEILKHFPVAL
jgi:hypothetical protein